MTVRNPLTLVFFVLFFILWEKSQIRINKTTGALMAGISALAAAAITVLFGKKAVSGFDSSLFRIVGMAIIFAGLFLVVLSAIRFGAWLVNRKNGVAENNAIASNASPERESAATNEVSAVRGLAVVLLSAIICFLCWFPYFLYEYPGIMTADSIVQYEQVIGVNPWSNHHPVIHTLCISIFYNLGIGFTGDVNKAISFYTIAQMIFLSLCCGRTVLQVRRVLGKGRWFLLSLVFFALVPFNAVFAVTIWKDVPFAGIMMLMGCRLCDMAMKEKNGAFDYVILSILAVLMALFRSNGWYAFLLCVPFMLWMFRGEMAKVLASIAAAIIVVVVIKGPVMNAAVIIQPDFTESLSLPIQQVARVLVEDRELTAEDKELIDAVIDTTYIHELYAADFADNMKELVRAGHPDVIENNKGIYLGLWMRLGLKYPLDYVRAWFDLEGGYVYPDIPYDVGNIDGIMGNNYGLVPTPLIGGKAVVKGKEILIKLGSFVPLYGMLWCAGAYTWLVIFTLFVMLGRGSNKKLLLPIILQAALIFTLLIAAPVVDFRYEYGITMLMPLTLSICVMIMKAQKCENRM
jgi:hypothetical protein